MKILNVEVNKRYRMIGCGVALVVLAIIVASGISFNYFANVVEKEEKDFRLFNEIIGDYVPYMAQLHAHTSYSDGTGIPKEAFAYAKDPGKLNIFFLTEHAELIDTWNDRIENSKPMGFEWEDIEAQARSATTTDFLGFRGFEWTSWIYGHMNVFFTEDYVKSGEMYEKSGPNAIYIPNLEAFYDWIASTDEAIAQYNHPTWGNQYNSFEYHADADHKVVLFEVGNHEDQMDYEYKSAFDKCLDSGWHVGVAANQDNHQADWGTMNELRTVPLMKSLDKTQLIDALLNRRTYATNDMTLRVVALCNKEMMGTQLQASEEHVTLEFFAEDTEESDVLDYVQLWTTGGELHSNWTLNGTQAYIEEEIDISELPRNPHGEAWLYFRIVQEDGSVAFTSPFWVKG